MTSADHTFEIGTNAYLKHLTIGLVYEGVKEIRYNGEHLHLHPGTLFCLGFAHHQLRNTPDANGHYAEALLEYTFEEIAEIKLVDMPMLNECRGGDTPINKISLIGHTAATLRVKDIFKGLHLGGNFDDMSRTKRLATLFRLVAADTSNTTLRTVLYNLDERLLVLEQALMEEEFSTFSLERAAKRANLSPKSFKHLCRLKFSATPNEVLLQNCLDKAKWALQLTQTPICEIADSLGFKDNSYFTKFFKRHIGITPRQYRAKSARNMLSTD